MYVFESTWRGINVARREADDAGETKGGDRESGGSKSTSVWVRVKWLWMDVGEIRLSGREGEGRGKDEGSAREGACEKRG